MALNHIKPHGSLYGMAARDEEIANAVADAALVFKEPLLGMKGTLHEKVYPRRGLRAHSPNSTPISTTTIEGGLIITREHDAKDPDEAAAKCLRAMAEGKVRSVGGRRRERRRRYDLRPLRHAERASHRGGRARRRSRATEH